MEKWRQSLSVSGDVISQLSADPYKLAHNLLGLFSRSDQDLEQLKNSLKSISSSPKISSPSKGVSSNQSQNGLPDVMSEIDDYFSLLIESTVATQELSYAVFNKSVAAVTRQLSNLAKVFQEVYTLQGMFNKCSNFWSKYLAQFPSDKQADIGDFKASDFTDPEWIKKMSADDTRSDDPKGIIKQLIKDHWAWDSAEEKAGHWEFAISDATAENLAGLNAVQDQHEQLAVKGEAGKKTFVVNQDTLPSLLSRFRTFTYANSGLAAEDAKDLLPSVEVLGNLSQSIMNQTLTESGFNGILNYVSNALSELQALQQTYTSALSKAKSSYTQTEQFFQQDFQTSLNLLDINQ